MAEEWAFCSGSLVWTAELVFRRSGADSAASRRDFDRRKKGIGDEKIFPISRSEWYIPKIGLQVIVAPLPSVRSFAGPGPSLRIFPLSARLGDG